MPIGFLTEAERERLDGFPAQIVPGDIETYFTLSRADRVQIPRTTSAANRLGFALQLGTLRFLGFCPDDLSTIPEAVAAYVARQLDVAPSDLARYGRRGQTRTEHLRQIRRYLGFRKATAGDLSRLECWLVDRALEHDRPTLLLRLACEHLLGLRIERPGVTHLERLIASARQRAQQETYRRLAPILTRDCKARLDGLLTVDAATGRSNLAWLQQSAATYTPPMILATLEKRACCRRWGVDRWDVSSLTPNRLKFLAQIARRSTNQALQRMPEQRRYPILVAFLYQTLIDLTDEALDLFDRCLAEAYHRASRDLEDFRISVARSTNEKVRLFREIGGDQRLFRIERQKQHPHLGPLLKGRINRDWILRNWDDLLRVAGSLKRGWVTASLLIGKLQSYPRKNQLTRALQEYGRLVKTIFILRYLESEPLRRRINTQLNKGEALHGLREFLLFANKGVLRKKQEEELMNQAGCLNLVTNAVVTWNTVYMAAVIDRLRAEGKTVNEEDIARLSPARYEHINPYGKYRFVVEDGLSRSRLRPLRQPAEQQSR